MLSIFQLGFPYWALPGVDFVVVPMYTGHWPLLLTKPY